MSEVEFTSELVELQPGVLGFHAHEALRSFRFGEPVWVIEYRTEIFDSDSRQPGGNHLCHTFIGDQQVMQRDAEDGGLPEMRAIYTDAFTGEVRLPEGFGIRLAAEEKLEWMPMFNNRGEGPVRVGMRGRIRVIREKDLQKPLTPLYSSLWSVQVPHLYFVPPGGDAREILFELPFDGRIHFIGSHVHPHAESIELFNVSRGERVWEGKRQNDESGQMIGMGVYSSVEGYAVEAMETYRLTAVYENPTERPIDAMAGIFILYSRTEGL